MAVHPKCMFRSERVPWYNVCLSNITDNSKLYNKYGKI